MDEAEICDNIAIIDSGKIVTIDTPYHLKQKHTKDKAYISSSNEQELQLLLDNANFIYNKKPGYFSIEVHDLHTIIEVLNQHRSNITDLEIKKGTLNDVFLEITGKDIRV